MLPGAWRGERNGELLYNEYGVLVLQDQIFWNFVALNNAYILNTTEIYA